jgi:hypothetical protein
VVILILLLQLINTAATLPDRIEADLPPARFQDKTQMDFVFGKCPDPVAMGSG